MSSMANKNNKLLKGLLCLSSALILVCGGYFAGMRAQTENVISALPRIDHDKVKEDLDNKTGMNAEEMKDNQSEFIGKSNVSEVAEGTWSTVDSCNCDITGDGTNDTITLYTSEPSDDMGILWSESQNWILEVSDGVSGYYTLENELLKNGSMYYSVMEHENGEHIIVAYKSTGTGTIVSEYVFSKSGFNKNGIYNSESTNQIHSSIPWYK